MSIAIDVAEKLHSRQISAAAKSQDLMVTALAKVAAVRDKAPSLPEPVAAPLAKAAAPLARLLGEPVDYVNYASRSTREWFELQQDFRSKVLGVVAGKQSVAATDALSKPSAGKKS